MSSETEPLPFGKLYVPPGWEARTEVTIYEPAQKGLAVPLAGKAETTKPRANISLVRCRTTHKDPAIPLHEFLAFMTKEIPGLQKSAESTVTFADGAPGIQVTVNFAAPNGLIAAQRHIYRIDAGVGSHLTATVEAHEKARLDKDLQDMILKYTPTSAG